MSERVAYTPKESEGLAPARGRLENRRVLVVGGGQMDIGEADTPIGNGRAMAVLCAREGARVGVADRDAIPAEATVALCEGRGFAITADVTKEADVYRMVDEAFVTMDGIDGLILNVGIGAGGPFLEGTSIESWNKVFAINLTSHMLTVKAALPRMPDGASIVFVSSIAGLTAGSRLPAYDSSKAALFGLCRHVAFEGARRGIRANVIAPGLMDTSIGRLASRGRPNRTSTNIPLGRQGTGWETAYAALFLMSDESAYITAQTFAVDGGLSGSDLHFRKASYEPGVCDFGTGCFAYLQPDGGWGFSNSGLITDGNESLLVDTMFDDAHTRAMLDGFKKASSAKIGTLVNTHHNGDHCYGNALVEGAEIIATIGAAEAMKHETPQGLAQFMKVAPNMGLTGEYLLHCFCDFDFEHCSTRAPDTTFTGHMTRHVGSKAVELIEVGPAHTGGDALVYVPSDKTIFTGDILFIDGHPILWAGPVGNWIAACEEIIAMDVETIVPGHGPITDKKGVQRLADYLVYIRDEAKKRYDSGMGALEAARSIALDDYAGWGDSERIAVNTATLYREFGAKDTPSDAATMFGWMAQIWKDKK